MGAPMLYMRIIGAILLFLLMSINGCNRCYPISHEINQKQTCTLQDRMETNQIALYTATAANRNALQEEANFYVPTTSVRILTNRNRVINQPVTIRQTLMQTHRPVLKNLIHHSVIQLVAFPKEYHIFRLRRILI